jgi:large subunit ribosomal protein L10
LNPHAGRYEDFSILKGGKYSLAISKERKDELLAQYLDLISNSRAIFVTEYAGMSVKEMESLRTKVREANGNFYVTKNTLFKLALEESGYTVSDELLNGQVATGFALGEIPTLAKTLVDFSEGKDQHLALRGALMGSDTLTSAQIVALAKLPSLNELRAQILGLINAPARDIAAVIAGSVRQVVNVVDAYAKSEEAEPEAA